MNGTKLGQKYSDLKVKDTITKYQRKKSDYISEGTMTFQKIHCWSTDGLKQKIHNKTENCDISELESVATLVHLNPVCFSTEWFS